MLVLQKQRQVPLDYYVNYHYFVKIKMYFVVEVVKINVRESPQKNAYLRHIYLFKNKWLYRQNNTVVKKLHWRSI